MNSAKNPWKMLKWNHIWPIAGAAIWIWMGLEEEAVDSDRRGRSGQGFDHRTVPAGRPPEPPWLLNRMGCIEDHWSTEAPHEGQAGHIIDQSAIAEKGSSFA